jgi:hypothetical protein
MHRLNSLDPNILLSFCDFTANVGKLAPSQGTSLSVRSLAFIATAAEIKHKEY